MGRKKDRHRFEMNVVIDWSPTSNYTQVSVGYSPLLDEQPVLRQHLFKLAVEHFAHATAKGDPDGYEKTLEYIAKRIFTINERLAGQSTTTVDNGIVPLLDLPDDDED